MGLGDQRIYFSEATIVLERVLEGFGGGFGGVLEGVLEGYWRGLGEYEPGQEPQMPQTTATMEPKLNPMHLFVNFCLELYSYVCPYFPSATLVTMPTIKTKKSIHKSLSGLVPQASSLWPGLGGTRVA